MESTWLLTYESGRYPRNTFTYDTAFLVQCPCWGWSEPEPSIVVTPTEVVQEIEYGLVATRSVVIANSGEAPLTWTAQMEGGLPLPWAVITPTMGTVNPSQSITATMVITTPPAPGTYRKNLVVYSNDPISPEIVVPVTLTVQAADIVVYPYITTITAPVNITISNRFLTVENASYDVALTWVMDDPPTWLMVVPMSGTFAPETRETLVTTFDTRELEIGGVYTATLVFRSNDPVEPVRTARIVLYVVEYYRVFLPLAVK